MFQKPCFFSDSFFLSPPRLFFLLILILTFLLYIPCVYAEVILTWNPNTEPDIAGYKIYYGTASGYYQFCHDVGSQTSYPIPQLNHIEVGTYFFALTAYDSNDHESDLSNEIFYEVSEDLTDLNHDEIIEDEDNSPNVIKSDQTDTDNNGSGVDDEISANSNFITPVVIEAEQMRYHANGTKVGEYWLLWGNGFMSEAVDFSSTNIYRFEITAKGELANAKGPEMELLVDGEVIDTVWVNNTNPETFIFEAYLSEGIHEFAIGYHNDFYDPSAGADRNLYVDKTTISMHTSGSSASPSNPSDGPSGSWNTVIEAEQMSYHANGSQVGDYWLLWGNGTMSEDIDFSGTDIYRFEITAKGSLADDMGPEMRFMIDGQVIDTVFVNSTEPETFVFEASISEGSHEFAIGYYNDLYDPSAGVDRNLYVDKTTISQNSSGSNASPSNPPDGSSDGGGSGGTSSGNNSSGGSGSNSSNHEPDCNTDADCNDDYVCHSQSGSCVECFEDIHCDDGLVCNGIEVCFDNLCIGGNNPCNENEICDEENDMCMGTECQSDAECDDDVFCNGYEICSEGVCTAGEPACNKEAVCIEEAQECLEVLFISAVSLIKDIPRPIIREKRCQWLILATDDFFYFNDASHTIDIEYMENDFQGVEIDPHRNPLHHNNFIFIPLCIWKNATVGQYKIIIRSYPVDEALTADFNVR